MFHRPVLRLKLAVLFQILLDIAIVLLPVRGQTCSAMVKATAGDDLTTLREKTFAAFRKECRPHKTQPHEIKSNCSFTTVAAKPHNFTFILKPLSVPFRLDFAVKTKKDAGLALAEDAAHGSIFAEISIGAAANTRVVMRPYYYLWSAGLVAYHEEAGLVDADEYRSFWINYQGGVVKVGKGGQEEAFLEWDAGAYHQRVATQVRIGIASRKFVGGDWVFYKFCE